MKCTHCRTDSKSQVIETRDVDGVVYRRRRCLSCGESYITGEQACREVSTIPRVQKPTTRHERRAHRAERLALGLGRGHPAQTTPPDRDMRVANTEVFKVWG